MLNDVVRDYNEAVFDTDSERAMAVVETAVSMGVSPEDIVFKVVIPAIEDMMTLINRDPDANLAQHFMTAQIAAAVTERMVARFAQPPAVLGHVIIGTSRGDLHSLGKRIVTGCLKSLMIGVTDLGVNIAPERFVEAAVEEQAQVIAISSMMVHTAKGAEGCLAVRELLRRHNLEETIKIVVGGAPYRFDPNLYKAVGADDWASDGISAGKIIQHLIREVKSS